MKKNYLLLILIITVIFSFGLCACGSEEAVSSTGELSAETDGLNEDESGIQSLEFVDAWGEWHETVVLEDVEKHEYDWSLLQNDGQNISYGDEDSNYKIICGIDVSHHQGEIDWNAVADDGYEFAIIRIAYRAYGNGELFYDRTYRDNIIGAQAAGLKVGVYIFSQAINEAEAKEEAEFVIEGLKDFDLDLEVVYDPELIRDEEARTDDVSGEIFTENTVIFCDMISDAGYTPMVYSNMVWEAELFDMTLIDDYKIWYADYELIPQTPYIFDYWQYSEKGEVSGISGNVDLNVMFQKIK